MDEELINNCANLSHLKTLLCSKRGTEIISLLNKLLNDTESDRNLQLLEITTCGVYEHDELLELCEALIDYLWSQPISDAYRPVLSVFLGNTVEILEDWKVERLCVYIFQKLCTDCVEFNCIFETLGKGVVRLENSTNVLAPCVKSLCDMEWSIKNTERLLISFKDYPFNLSSRSMIVQKSLSSLPDYPSQTVNIFIQSVLALSCPKSLPIVFDHVHLYFTTQSFDVKQQILLTFVQLCTDSEQFRSNLISALKTLSQAMVLREFITLLLLSILPIQSLQSQALNLLNISILSTFSDRFLISESSFLRGLCDAPDNPVNFILNMIDLCTTHPDNCLRHGLTLLGFGLLRTINSMTGLAQQHINRRAHSGSITKSGKPVLASPFAHQHDAKACIFRLGVDILVGLFKHSSVCRNDIMTVTTNMLWSDSSKPIATKLVDLLSELVAVSPIEVVSTSTNQLDPILDSIGLVPLELATGLVHALLPLIRAGTLLPDLPSNDNPIHRIRARLFSILCKAAQSPRIDTRRQAVACFMLLLKHLKVSVSSFRSASQSMSSNMSQGIPFSQMQGATQQNPAILYTQLQCTQVARQAIALPCDMDQNEALCTEIVGILHRIIFSAFFRSQVGGLLEDPGSRIKADIYWGLCEVVMRNRGLCEPVLNLYMRLLLSCLSPHFLRELKNRAVPSLTVPTVIEPSQPPSNEPIGPPLNLEGIIQSLLDSPIEMQQSEHPDILSWCLQLVLTLPQFDLSWKQYRLRRTQSENSAAPNESQSQSTGAFSQFTQSTLGKSIECGRAISSTLFTKAVTVLLSLSDSLRSTPLDDFKWTTETDFGPSAIGKVNLKRAELLLSLYDACLEFELKDPLELIGTSLIRPTQADEQMSNQGGSWTRIRHLYARRSNLMNLINTKLPGSTQQQQHPFVGLLSLHAQRGQSRVGLLMMGLLSATQSDLSRLLRLSRLSNMANSLSQHVLQTIHSRLQQFAQGSGVPYAYRDGLTRIMIPLLRHMIRFYNQKLLDTSATSGNTSADGDVKYIASTMPQTKARPSDTCSQALNVLDSCFALAFDHLGTERLHTLTIRLYSVVNDPCYPQSIDETMGGETEVVDCPDDANDLETGSTDVSPAQALSALIKLVKTWVTKLLSPSSRTSTQKSPTLSNTKDLIILLPLLIRLCRVRANITSGDSGRQIANPYAGLDRVLSWLLRLMRSSSSSSNPLPNPVRVQLINQALWLAHLVIPCSPSSKSKSKNDDALLDLDYLLTAIASDLRAVIGDAADLQENGYLPDELRSGLTFNVITRSAAPSIFPLLFVVIRSLCSEFDWILAQWLPDLGNRISHQLTGKVHNHKLDHHDEETLCHRLMSVGTALAELLRAAVPSPSANADSLLDISARVFNFLTQLVKYYLRIARSRCGRFPVIFERLVNTFGRIVSPNAYTFVSYIQHLENEKIKSLNETNSLKKDGKHDKIVVGKPGGKKMSKAVISSHTIVSRSIKNSRLIPQLVFAIEQFERFLMQLSKVSKVNLMRNIKLAVSRDFRINSHTVMVRLETSTAADSLSDDDADEQDAQSPSMITGFDVPEDLLCNQGLVDTCSSRSIIDLQLPDSNSENRSSTNSVRTPSWDRAVRPSSTRLSAIKRTFSGPNPGNYKKPRSSLPLSPKNN